MASLLAVVAAADRYAYMWDGHAHGVVLAGRLGSVAAWDGGAVELDVNQAAAGAESTPYWAHNTDPALLECAKKDFAAFTTA